MPDIHNKIYKSASDLEAEDIRSIYKGFNSPIAEFDCGKKCALISASKKDVFRCCIETENTI
jgi:hypothetical protein